MADSTPLPSLLSLVPHDVSQDPPFDGNNNHPLPIIPDAFIGDRTMAATMAVMTAATTAATTAGAAAAGGCNDNCLKACIVAASMPSPSLLSLVPHGITLDEIRLAHAPPLSPVRANNAPVVNLFCGLQGVSQNKRLSLPREMSGHTPARKKHGGTIRHASSVKARGAIKELLATLHVDDSLDRGAISSDLHRPIVTPHCDVAGVGDNKDDTLVDDDYHPMSGLALPPHHAYLNKRRSSPRYYSIVHL
jgi:hypothetical protein